MNIAKVPLANTVIGSNHGITINTNDRSWLANFKPYGTGVSMNFLDVLWTLFRWKHEGWEVHPINIDDEFTGWV
jgi:hypothetical protein